MIIIKFVSWGDFKRLVLNIDKSYDSNSHLIDCGRFIDDTEYDLMDGNKHIFAMECIGELTNHIEWNVDIDVLKLWRDMLDELANTAMIGGFNGNVSRNDYNAIQSICDDIESYLTDNEYYKTCAVCGECDETVILHGDYGVDICHTCHDYINENMVLLNNVDYDVFKRIVMKIENENNPDNELNDMGEQIRYIGNVDDVNYNYIWSMKWGVNTFINHHVYGWIFDILHNIDLFDLSNDDVAFLRMIKNMGELTNGVK